MRERTLTVSQINEYVKGVFEDELILHDLGVEGEIFEYKKTASATFVTLKEKDCLLGCVSFDSVCDFSVGDKVILFGSVSFYERTGKVSFVFRSAKKTGAGDILAEFNALKEKLRGEGLFENKKPLPPYVRKIAIVTAITGAVIHDFIKTVHRKHKFCSVEIYPSAVQGKTAVTELTENLRLADKSKSDVVIVARGGGSGDDLSAFNNETLVRAVAACSTPVISAVGHETDFTLCDFAASVRAGTPSMAGELISRINEDFYERILNAAMRIERGALEIFSRKTAVLKRASETVARKSELKFERVRTKVLSSAEHMERRVNEVVSNREIAVKRSALAIAEKTRNAANKQNERLQKAAAKLDGNNPLRILSMGYAKLTDKRGQPVRYDSVAVGDDFAAVVDGGKLTAKVTEKKEKISVFGGNNGT